MREDYLTLVDTNSTFGMYVCTAANELGDASKYVTLKEGFRPTAIETVRYREYFASMPT